MVGLHPGDLHERTHTGALATLQDAQTEARENAVLSGERHEVGHGAHRGEVEIVAQLDALRHRMFLRAQEFQQAVREFENETDGAEVVPRLVAVASVDVRVDEQTLVERLLLRAMVIDHHHIDALADKVGDLLVRVGAAVERDEKLGLALLQRAVDGAARKAVTVLHAARHDEARLRAKAAQDAHEQRGAAHAVHIVVAEDDDVLARVDGFAQARGARLHVVQEERIVELGEGGPQKTRGRYRVAKSVAEQQLGYHGTHPRGDAQLPDLVGRERLIGPAHQRLDSLFIARPCSWRPTRR